jgi:elongation factor P--(R)-beta-lysine ligase
MERNGSMKPLWWQRDEYARRRPYLAARSRIITAIRRLLVERGFCEVETPALQVSPGMEPHLLAFATELQEPGEGTRPFYLHTSPEFAMKKLLAAGERKIFQFAHVFRNGERAATHHPEFTMLEWYRAEAGTDDLMADCEVLLRASLAAAGGAQFRWRGAVADPTWPFPRLSVADAFQRYCGIDLLATAPDPMAPDLARLAAAARPIGVLPHPGDSWEDLFFRLFLDRIEPRLGIGTPTILHGYPISMAALARARPDDARVADRFELYVAGLELANAFGELTDPAEQRARFLADQEKKRRLYGLTYPIDEDFLNALVEMPPAAGIALGLDRLVMLATGATRIEDVLWAPVA